MAKFSLLAFLVVAQLFSANAQWFGGATSITAILAGVMPTSPVKTTYAAVGSGTGRKNFISGSYLLTSTDNAFTPAEDTAYCGAQKLPAPTAINAGHLILPYVVISFGVFVSTNAVLGTVPKTSTLTMSAAQLATIYSDNACNWNAIYPGKSVNLVYFVRCESSGTTKVFTSYLTLYGGSAWTFGNSFSAWPGLPACVVDPADSAAYKTCGQPSLNSYTMAQRVLGCKATGCITYIQSGFGKGKGTSPGQAPIFLSEVKIPNKAGVSQTSATCSVTQALPAQAPSNRANWATFDGNLLSATGAKTCPLIAVNFIAARYRYPGNPNPKKLLQYLFVTGYKPATLIAKAATVIPGTYKTRAVAAISSIA